MASYADFFTATATVAGSLVGLLFVALSVERPQTKGAEETVERDSVAATAFTALIDSLFISLFALLPGNRIPRTDMVIGILGLISTAVMMISLWRARDRAKLSRRWPFLLSLIVLAYGYQLFTGFTARSHASAESATTTLVFIFFGVGIGRSWELLGGRRGGVAGLFSIIAEKRAGRPNALARESSDAGISPADTAQE